MALMLHGPLMAWILMSLTREVVQMRLCTDTTRTQCNRMVFSPGYLFAGRFHYLQESCVSTRSIYSSILTCFVEIFQTSCICLFLNTTSCNYMCLFHKTNCSHVCSCFTILNSVYYFFLLNFLSPLCILVSCHHVMVLRLYLDYITLQEQLSFSS